LVHMAALVEVVSESDVARLTPGAPSSAAAAAPLRQRFCSLLRRPATLALLCAAVAGAGFLAFFSSASSELAAGTASTVNKGGYDGYGRLPTRPVSPEEARFREMVNLALGALRAHVAGSV
jgi:hypothetical protein